MPNRYKDFYSNAHTKRTLDMGATMGWGDFKKTAREAPGYGKTRKTLKTDTCSRYAKMFHARQEGHVEHSTDSKIVDNAPKQHGLSQHRTVKSRDPLPSSFQARLGYEKTAWEPNRGDITYSTADTVTGKKFRLVHTEHATRTAKAEQMNNRKDFFKKIFHNRYNNSKIKGAPQRGMIPHKNVN